MFSLFIYITAKEMFAAIHNLAAKGLDLCLVKYSLSFGALTWLYVAQLQTKRHLKLLLPVSLRAKLAFGLNRLCIYRRSDYSIPMCQTNQTVWGSGLSQSNKLNHRKTLHPSPLPPRGRMHQVWPFTSWSWPSQLLRTRRLMGRTLRKFWRPKR